MEQQEQTINEVSAGQVQEEVCSKKWRLKSNVVLRIEEDGAILFDPSNRAMTVVNPIATALLRWRPDNICYDEWCRSLEEHYGNVACATIRKDLKMFLEKIISFLESCHEGSK